MRCKGISAPSHSEVVGLVPPEPVVAQRTGHQHERRLGGVLGQPVDVRDSPRDGPLIGPSWCHTLRKKRQGFRQDPAPATDTQGTSPKSSPTVTRFEELTAL